MYHVTIKSSRGRVIAEALREGLAEAVNYGHKKSLEGNSISVYEALQDATGAIMHLHKVVTFMKPKGNIIS
jgi:metal-responsive CopG/Arc/MetJ family transcriptional regulator